MLLRMASPGGLELGMEFRPQSLVKLVAAQQFDSFPDLQCRTRRKEMQKRAHAGHTGEGAWTITDPSAEEVLSSMVHIVGFVVLYHGQAGWKSMACQSREKCAMAGVDVELIPPWARPPKVESKIGDDR